MALALRVLHVGATIYGDSWGTAAAARLVLMVSVFRSKTPPGHLTLFLELWAALELGLLG